MNSEIALLSLRDAGVKLIDCVHKTPAGVDQGFPYIAIPQLTEGRIDVDDARRISEQDMIEWNVKCDPQEDDIVLSRRCNPGVTAVIPKEFRGSLGQNLVLLRATDPNLMEPKYLRWVTRGREWWNEVGRYINVGAVFESLRCADIPEFAIPVPPVAEQKAIAHILGTLDDKIELNRKTNETLEAMAKALFKSWFVDFDPVRAKAEGRPTGLPAEISDLFPDSFEDSELGEIPRGWRDCEIQDVAELNPETWGSRNQPLSVRYLDLSNVKHGKIDSVEEYQWEDAPSRARRILKTGDTVVGTVRPGIGSYCLIVEDGITGSTGFAVLRPKNKNDSAFVYLGSCSKENIDRLAHLADGGAYPAVRPELIAQTPVIIAARDLLDCFSRSVSPLFAAAEERKLSSKLLCQVRDALLPKLISGELRIPDAEKMLQEVGV
jgi:type I restriction enzyme S subunit